MIPIQPPNIAIDSPPRVHELRWLEDYTGVRRRWSECAAPATEDELHALLRWARQEGRTVTLRGGGQCLHGQSLGDDLVIDVSALNQIHVDVQKGTLTAGAGARWADVYEALPPGWVLKNLVSTGAASVGGTLMADAASRFSSAFGREADGVRSVRFMTAEGVTLVCDREGPHAALFHGLPGSVGVLGVLLSVEHVLVDVRHLLPSDGALRVRTVARKHPNAKSLLADLALELRAPRSERCPRGAYGLIVPDGALLFHSMYTGEPRGRRMPSHRRRDPLRSVIERVLHAPSLNRTLWRAIFTHYYRDGDHFVDNAEDFAFFMDAGASRGYAARLGLWSGLMQQAVELPFDASAEGCEAADAMVQDCAELSRTRDVYPVVWDVLAIRGNASRPHALRFTMAVALQSRADEERARTFLSAQAKVAAAHGARVVRGKGVYADANTLASTMRDELAALQHLKAQWDPSALFGGPFYRDVLQPAMHRATGGRTPKQPGEES